ncbi:hypothetical protein [Nisaea sp.]|uniref:hypothetical protein n=1 Tax=Nisaea sp. TaxID=2024842 RepID=UPI002B277FDA|nr:hypothetical protein [Nisaea sp.]
MNSSERFRSALSGVEIKKIKIPIKTILYRGCHRENANAAAIEAIEPRFFTRNRELAIEYAHKNHNKTERAGSFPFLIKAITITELILAKIDLVLPLVEAAYLSNMNQNLCPQEWQRQHLINAITKELNQKFHGYESINAEEILLQNPSEHLSIKIQELD